MQTLLRTSLTVTVLLSAAGTAVAQKDRIVLHDGKVIDGVTVTSFDLRNAEFKRRGAAETVPNDQVAELHVQKVQETYRRAYAAKTSLDGPGYFLTRARELDDKFLKQFGYIEAAWLFAGNDQYAEAFEVLDELEKELPDSGFVPEVYRMRCRYYAAEGQAQDLASVANRYETAALTKGFPHRCAVEAKYYGTLAKALAGELDAPRLRAAMKGQLAEAAPYPAVANLVRLQIADALRQENQLAEAAEGYQELLDADYLDESVRASAWLGLGHVHFAEGTPTNREAYREALLAFLRVYVETPDAAPAIVEESLKMGREAAQKWGGTDSPLMAHRLEAIRRREFPGKN